MSDSGSDPITSLEIFVTAEEAFPAFENLFLAAEMSVHAGFRVFDLDTPLKGKKAREIGATWFDLFEHTLSRGVDITLVVSDFDPVIATDYHRKSWESAHRLAAVEAVADHGRLTFRIARHPARAGIVPRTLLRGKVREKFLEADPDRHTPGLEDLSEKDLFELSPVTHHQKLAVFDAKTLYIGGLDLDERRYDTRDHAREAEDTWQDVQVCVEGPVVRAALEHLETFESAVDGRCAPPPPSDGFLRTLSARRWPAPFHISPRTVVNELETAHLDAISRARELIYLETQYLRHLPLADAIADAGKDNPDLRLIVVIPAAPEDVAFEGNEGRDAKMGEQLQADAIARIEAVFRDRAVFCSPAQHVEAEDTDGRDTLQASPIIYVHSKVSIFDEAEAIVSSANLNGRSFRWDTEAGVHLTHAAHVRALRDRMVDHWMPTGLVAEAETLTDLYDLWRKTVMADFKCAPQNRRSMLLPYNLRAAEDMGEPVSYVPDELV